MTRFLVLALAVAVATLGFVFMTTPAEARSICVIGTTSDCIIQYVCPESAIGSCCDPGYCCYPYECADP